MVRSGPITRREWFDSIAGCTLGLSGLVERTDQMAAFGGPLRILASMYKPCANMSLVNGLRMILCERMLGWALDLMPAGNAKNELIKSVHQYLHNEVRKESGLEPQRLEYKRIGN